MKKFEEVKRPAIGIEQSSIKPSLGKVIEFYTDKVKEYHNAFNEMNKYIDGLEAQLDYYKKDKRFEVMAEEILSLKSQIEKRQPEIPECVAEFIENYDDINETSLLYIMKDFVESKHWEGFCKIPDDLKKYGRWDDMLYKAIRFGYTVDEEKVFYLKNKLTGYYLIKQKSGRLSHTCTYPTLNPLGWKFKFTQSEIDSMEIGSYEQIEVEE